jgi:4-amino-4-deoxy-L-arabinose transferase-like glycosyltransferase
MSRHLSGIVAFWTAVALFIGIRGEFPLFDDWVYALQVEELVKAHRLHSPLSSENLLLPQIAWATLFALPRGFSFEALRLSTLTAAAVATLALYLTLIELNVQRGVAFFCSLALAANPLFVSLAFTFMSDVPTMALCVAGLWAFARGERLQSSKWFWIGITLTTLGTLNRLSAAVIVVAIALGHGLATLTRRRMLESAAAIIVAFAILEAAEAWLKATIGVPGMYGIRGRLLAARLLHLTDGEVSLQIVWAMTRSAMMLGCFVLPVFVWTRLRLSIASLAGMILLAIVVVTLDKRLPLMGNILYERGLGPVMVRGIEGDGVRWAWWALTALSIVGAALVAEVSLLTLRAIWRERRAAIHPQIQALRVTALVSLWALVFAHAPVNVFDRYLLAALPALLVLGLLEYQTRATSAMTGRWLPALAMLVAMALFSVLATRDAMQWQRARWQVIHSVIARGVPAMHLDGGYEFNGQVRGIGFSPGGPSITHHLELVDEVTAEALSCRSYRAWIGPRATAICALPGPD